MPPSRTHQQSHASLVSEYQRCLARKETSDERLQHATYEHSSMLAVEKECYSNIDKETLLAVKTSSHGGDLASAGSANTVLSQLEDLKSKFISHVNVMIENRREIEELQPRLRSLEETINSTHKTRETEEVAIYRMTAALARRKLPIPGAPSSSGRGWSAA